MFARIVCLKSRESSTIQAIRHRLRDGLPPKCSNIRVEVYRKCAYQAVSSGFSGRFHGLIVSKLCVVVSPVTVLQIKLRLIPLDNEFNIRAVHLLRP